MKVSYSSAKLTFLWCLGWLSMYLHTLSTSDFDTENAASDSCQAKRPVHNLISLINLEALSDTIDASYASDNSGDRDTRIWTCSGLA